MNTPPASEIPNARLYCLIARNARKAVILRRGPSKQVRLLAWDLKTDRIDPGQWLKARVYERRCDLSPNGSHFAYFAASNRPPVGSWTAVSYPPDFTAISFFPKGDAWGGGGLFADEKTLRLNHRFETPAPPVKRKSLKRRKIKRAPRYMRNPTLRPWESSPTVAGLTYGSHTRTEMRNRLGLKIVPLGNHAGAGEDHPIETLRLQRDGWVLSDLKHKQSYNDRSRRFGIWITFDPPVRRFRDIGKTGLRLQVSMHGIGENQGSWYVETMEILGKNNSLELGRIDWTDLDHNNDVLYAAQGKLFRMKVRTFGKEINTETAEVADLNAMRFEAIPPRLESVS